MKKFKLLLVAFLLPITFIIYYFTSEKFGISAYLDKQKSLEKIYFDNNNIQNQIAYYKNKIKLLNNENPDLDLLNEKAFEALGLIEENSLVINTNNL